VLNKYQDSLEIKRFGIGALVKRNDKIETYALGIAGDSIALTTDKVFNIGSLTKTFTAVLIMQEIEKGNLSLNDSLHNFFPSELIVNENVNLNITIEQLLRHRSGLGEVNSAENINSSIFNPYNDYSRGNIYSKIPKSINLPDERYDYKNTNYILLGYILELANNKEYRDILQERIFEPAGMKNSYSYYSPLLENSAHPMDNGEDYAGYTFYNHYKNLSFSAGGIASNLNDLQLFFENLYEKETFIKKETFELMTNTETSYGLGIEILKKGKNKDIYYGHGGDNYSFKIRNYYNPKNGDLIIVFSNQQKDPFTQKIADELVDILAKKN
jgi:CubicO group peptidase (beta-lactamase class C family)